MTGAEPVALVTGASAGIGLYTALGLARAGFHVIVAGRDLDRTTRAVRQIAKRTGSEKLTTALADFASLTEVRRLAETVLAEHDRLDLLVNNAGLIAPRFALTADGVERTLAVNHLAPFLLTNLLLDRLKQSAPSRIVTVASVAHRGARLDLADFSRLAEVRRLADEILTGHDRLDVLVNNAGLFSPKYRLSADGYELTFAVNHLAPFLLTNLLLDRLKASASARVVTVASAAHRGNRLDVAALTHPRDWTMMRAYGRSKLCNILFTRELASRLDPAQVVAVCLHPGVVATAIGQRGGLVELGWRLYKPFMIGPEQGADTPVFLSTVPDPTPFHGGYVIRRALAEPDPAARDSDLARRLWDESARLTGLG